MKAVAILGLTFALIAATAKTVPAHVDDLGQPDPYWQQIAAARAAQQAAAAQAADHAAASDAAAPDWPPPEIVVDASGATSLLLVASLLWSLWTALGDVDTWVGLRATPRPREAVGRMRAVATRTVDVLPPSASGETRLVLCAAAAIVLGAVFMMARTQG